MSDTIKWDPESTETLETILAEIPFLMRGQVRGATVQKAEDYARRNGTPSVSRDDVLIALILITPKGMREGLKGKFRQFGVDPESFAKYFEI